MPDSEPATDSRDRLTVDQHGKTPAVVLQNIAVTFGSVTALSNVTVAFTPGERHAVIGENGAGKSTLMRVLFGLQVPTSGQILFDNTPMRFSTPARAMAAGVGMVQQHFELIPAFSVAENILLGVETAATHGLRFDKNAAHAIVKAFAKQNGLPIDPAAKVGALSVAAQQRVEILKALYRHARILILDEPTAVLSPAEARDLWESVRTLSEAGTTIVFVTHKIADVMANADTVTVLRRGAHILTLPTAETTPDALAEAMIGGGDGRGSRQQATGNRAEGSQKLVVRRQEAGDRKQSGSAADDSTVLEVGGLGVRAGEIVGLAGVDGSGQAELIETVVGLRAGRVSLLNENISHMSIAARRARGIGYIPEDRHHRAVVLALSCEENAILGQQRQPDFARNGWLRSGEMAAFLQRLIVAFDVRGASVGLPIGSLSGGNQQKLVLARELSRNPRLLIAAQPTRGLDFAATAFVHASLQAAREAGMAIVLQSLDLDEIILLSDRVAVMRDGKIVAVLEKREATEQNIGAYMTGTKSGTVQSSESAS